MKIIKILMKIGLTKEIAIYIEMLANRFYLFELKDRFIKIKNKKKFFSFYGRKYCKKKNIIILFHFNQFKH